MNFLIRAFAPSIGRVRPSLTRRRRGVVDLHTVLCQYHVRASREASQGWRDDRLEGQRDHTTRRAATSMDVASIIAAVELRGRCAYPE